MTRSLAAAVVAFTLPVFAITAANAAERRDPKDTDGRLDIVFTRATGDKGDVGHLKIGTEDRWRCGYLKRNRNTSLRWVFDDGRDGDIDLVGKFVCREDVLNFNLRGPDTGNRYEPLTVQRPNRRTVKVNVPFDLVEFEDNHMGVVARSKDGEAPACETPCSDRAPNKSSMKVY
jgi:hypothetical protein